MKKSLLNKASGERQTELKQSFVAAAFLRETLQEVMKDKMMERFNASLLLEDYDNANWSYKQADLVGYNRALKEIISLLD